MAADVVKMKKGNSEATAVRSAYEAVWKDKGWELVEDDSDATRAQSAPSSSGVRKSTSSSSDDDK